MDFKRYIDLLNEENGGKTFHFLLEAVAGNAKDEQGLVNALIDEIDRGCAAQKAPHVVVCVMLGCMRDHYPELIDSATKRWLANEHNHVSLAITTIVLGQYGSLESLESLESLAKLVQSVRGTNVWIQALYLIESLAHKVDQLNSQIEALS